MILVLLWCKETFHGNRLWPQLISKLNRFTFEYCFGSFVWTSKLVKLEKKIEIPKSTLRSARQKFSKFSGIIDFLSDMLPKSERTKRSIQLKRRCWYKSWEKTIGNVSQSRLASTFCLSLNCWDQPCNRLIFDDSRFAKDS